VIPSGVHPNIIDVIVKFRSYTSSNTCNPYGIAWIEVGAVYPYTGQFILSNYNAFGSGPFWNNNTYGYYLAMRSNSTPSLALAATLSASTNVTYELFFVFNDTNVEIDAELEIIVISRGPPNGWFFQDAD